MTELYEEHLYFLNTFSTQRAVIYCMLVVSDEDIPF